MRLINACGGGECPDSADDRAATFHDDARDCGSGLIAAALDDAGGARRDCGDVRAPSPRAHARVHVAR